MKCPVCTTPDLLMTDRQGVEIDYCPQCRGVWLDRGELDKIIERSSQPTERPVPVAPGHQAAGAYPPPPPPQQTAPPYPPPPPQPTGYANGHDSHKHGYGHGGYHKKKSFLSDLFDFD